MLKWLFGKTNTVYFYTAEDRNNQLINLANTLRELIPVVTAFPEFSSKVKCYELALGEAEILLNSSFSQEQLSALGRSVPDLFFRHKEWFPPLVEVSPGNWQEEEWFKALDAKLLPALSAARLLCEVGYY